MAQLAWPLPALAAWGLAWLTFIVLPRVGAPAWLALVLAVALGVALALPQSTRSRRLMVAAGFPASLLASGMAIGLPAWAWLLPLGLLATAYPHRAWSDAPLYPTPEHSLDDLPPLAPLADGERVLDAGCGLGHGLRALRRAYPRAHIEGIEWSWPLALLTRLSCPWAQVSRGDMWAQSWQPFALVYLFQRPESMARAWAKARAELAPGAWLVSLEFEIAEIQPFARLQTKSGKNVCLYRVPGAHPS
ncbi:MAG: class I SAM-dependent methyltransferase [Burkholderiaceae bacterium]|nr:class I SAM-dependent methyltransferase [Burkholderiaceae bacterium]